MKIRETGVVPSVVVYCCSIVIAPNQPSRGCILHKGMYSFGVTIVGVEQPIYILLSARENAENIHEYLRCHTIVFRHR